MSEAVAGPSDDGWAVFDGLPGHPMMWVLILSEIVVFGLILAAFAVARLFDLPAFSAGQAQLNVALGFANTLVLVTGGWLAARGSAAAAGGRRRAARLWLAASVVSGVAFLVVKGIEYAGEISAGAGLETSPFFTLYFLITGFHALHVALGAVILAVVGWSADADAVETGTAFWHMVDLVWIVLFPVIYLVR